MHFRYAKGQPKDSMPDARGCTVRVLIEKIVLCCVCHQSYQKFGAGMIDGRNGSFSFLRPFSRPPVFSFVMNGAFFVAEMLDVRGGICVSIGVSIHASIPASIPLSINHGYSRNDASSLFALWIQSLKILL